MNDSKNLILAVVLSALVLLGWTWAANKYFPSNPPTTKVEAGKQQPLPQTNAQPSAPSTPRATQSVSAALASSPRVSIRTPSLLGSINLKGAQIDDLLLLRQKQTIDNNIRVSPQPTSDTVEAGPFRTMAATPANPMATPIAARARKRSRRATLAINSATIGLSATISEALVADETRMPPRNNTWLP